MITLTAAAAEQVRALQRDDPSRALLRVYVAGQTCCSYRYGLAFDSQTQEGDSVDELDGVRIAVDADSQPQCEGATIDFVSTAKGEGFVVRGVKSGGGCGCGRSG
jgi:iron-sulfur cluster assembly accessory protein